VSLVIRIQNYKKSDKTRRRFLASLGMTVLLGRHGVKKWQFA